MYLLSATIMSCLEFPMVSLFFSAVPSKIRDSNSQVPIGLISAQAPIIMSVMEGQICSRSLYFKWCRRCWRLNSHGSRYLQIFPQVFVVILKWLKCMIFASLPSKHHARIQRWCCLHPKHDTIWHMSVIIDRVGTFSTLGHCHYACTLGTQLINAMLKLSSSS